MEEFVIYIILGVIFLVVRLVGATGKSKNQQRKPVTRKTQQPTVSPKRTTSSRQTKTESIDDIFKKFVEELEQKNKPKPQPKRVQQTKAPERKSNKLVSGKHPQKRLIKEVSHHAGPPHDEFHIDYEKDLASDDGVEFDFDLRDAIIAKEILERKYF